MLSVLKGKVELLKYGTRNNQSAIVRQNSLENNIFKDTLRSERQAQNIQ